jgi:hypothetical protein
LPNSLRCRECRLRSRHLHSQAWTLPRAASPEPRAARALHRGKRRTPRQHRPSQTARSRGASRLSVSA